ncbi:unnamed protein product [Angiostrongylus costaricensis]|uniref:Lipoprotein n=1 Tax=Angiostrongylus costaricensis TaxID=334426 RepID=A0A0R3PXY2_ANGCS|nr:unnamed protein product [Angiostrongylus costaricensis]
MKRNGEVKVGDLNAHYQSTVNVDKSAAESDTWARDTNDMMCRITVRDVVRRMMRGTPTVLNGHHMITNDSLGNGNMLVEPKQIS